MTGPTKDRADRGDRLPFEPQQSSAANGDETKPLRRRLLIGGLLMIAVYTGGTLGYFVLGGGRWRLADCAYMTVISLTTVGYGEVLKGLDTIP